jgi:cell division protein FtsA
MKSGIYASLDIGTTSIKVIVAEVLNGQINVIGVGNERANGLKRAMIVDIEQTAASIRSAVEQAEDKADVKINELIVGVPSNELQINSCYGGISINKNQQEIGNEDVQQVVAKAIEGSLNQEREVVNVTPEEFTVDGFDEIKDPRGMIGNRIEFRGTITSVPRSILHNIRKAVKRAGFSVRNIVLLPEAMGQVALTQDERNFGAILIDMGGGQTCVSVIHDDQLKSSYAIQEGGEYVSKDISIVLNTSIKDAEKLKRDVGHAYYPDMTSDRTVTVDVVGQKELERYKESYISEIIEARIAQIFEQLKFSLDNIGASQMPAGITISGGAASLPGIDRLAEEIFNIPVRIYIPDFMSVRYPAFTNAIGLVIAETNLSEVEELIIQTLLQKTTSHQPVRNSVQPVAKEESAESTTQASDQYEMTDPEDEETMADKIKNFFSGFFE